MSIAQIRIQKYLLLWFVLVVFSCVHAEEVPGIPEQTSVFVTTFQYASEKEYGEAEKYIKNELEDYKYDVKDKDNVELIGKVTDQPFTVLESNPDIDFLVDGFIDIVGKMAKVRIYYQGTTTVIPITAQGPGFLNKVATMVGQHISSQAATEMVVIRKASVAQATLQKNPEHFESLVTLGLFNFQKSQPRKAIEFLERALQQDPTHTGVHYALALSYKRVGKTKQMIQHLLKALEYDSNNYAASIALGNYYLTKGNINQAIGVYERWSINTQGADLARWNLAVAYNRKLNFGQVRTHLNAIPSTSQYYEDARSWLVDLRDQEREFEEQAQQQQRRLEEQAQQQRQRLERIKWIGFGAFMVILSVLIVRIYHDVKNSNKDIAAVAAAVIAGMFAIASLLIPRIIGS